MNKARPVNLDLTQIKFPPMAIVSICHRISGVLLFLFLPFNIYLLHQSLTSVESFMYLQEKLHYGFFKFFIWITICAALFHLVAGIRHLMMDFGVAESVTAGRNTAYIVFIISILLFIVIGVWLW